MPAVFWRIKLHIILANMIKQLSSWTFNFRKVVRQQIRGEVVDFIFLQFVWECDSDELLNLVNKWPSYCQCQCEVRGRDRASGKALEGDWQTNTHTMRQLYDDGDDDLLFVSRQL